MLEGWYTRRRISFPHPPTLGLCSPRSRPPGTIHPQASRGGLERDSGRILPSLFTTKMNPCEVSIGPNLNRGTEILQGVFLPRKSCACVRHSGWLKDRCLRIRKTSGAAATIPEHRRARYLCLFSHQYTQLSIERLRSLLHDTTVVVSTVMKEGPVAARRQPALLCSSGRRPTCWS